MTKVGLLLAWGASLVLAPVALAQPPVPKPGPEHAHLKQLVGTWDANVNFGGMESKGTMTYKMELGGLWLVGNFESEFGGQKFHGKGLDTYDPAKKKYISVWIDSMSATPMVSEGTYDKEKKVLTMIGEGPGMDGKPTKYRTVIEMKEKDAMVLTMAAPDKEGKFQTFMTINYKRKK